MILVIGFLLYISKSNDILNVQMDSFVNRYTETVGQKNERYVELEFALSSMSFIDMLFGVPVGRVFYAPDFVPDAELHIGVANIFYRYGFIVFIVFYCYCLHLIYMNFRNNRTPELYFFIITFVFFHVESIYDIGPYSVPLCFFYLIMGRVSSQKLKLVI